MCLQHMALADLCQFKHFPPRPIKLTSRQQTNYHPISLDILNNCFSGSILDGIWLEVKTKSVPLWLETKCQFICPFALGKYTWHKPDLKPICGGDYGIGNWKTSMILFFWLATFCSCCYPFFLSLLSPLIAVWRIICGCNNIVGQE